jgi:Golgi phosphoprotein 3
MSEGLTRRRGGGATGGGQDTGDGYTSGAGGSSRPDSRVANTGSTEGRNKVAYDPRDFSDDNETKTAPRLTLMEEVLLLGLKDKAVSFAVEDALPLACLPGLKRAACAQGHRYSPTI